MSDVTLEYGSTGFEKIQTEIEKLKDYTGKISSWFQPANRTLEEHATQGSNAFRKINTAIQESSSHVLGFIGHLARLGAVVGTVQGILGGLGVYAFERWTKSVLMATDSQRQLEASLLGVIRNQDAVNKIMGFARGYAAQSPIATQHEVLETMRELAYQPAIKPIMEEGDVNMMKRVMDVVQGLATMRPQEGIQGATYAFRQAMSGVWRTMQYQYGIRPEHLAAGAGMSTEEFESSPGKSFKALETYVLGATQQTTSLTTVMNKLRASYREWLEDLGKTGIYDKVLGYLTRLNEFFRRIGESEQWKGITQSINVVLEGIANGIANILTKGIDWEKVTDLSGALKAFGKVAENATEEIKKVLEEKKESITTALGNLLVWVASTTAETVGNLFIPVGGAIVKGIIEGVAKAEWNLLPKSIQRRIDEIAGEMVVRNILNKPPEVPVWMGPKPFAGQWPGVGSDALMANILMGKGDALTAMYGGRATPLTETEKPPFKLGATEQFGIFSMWSKMGEQFAQRPEYLQTPLEKMTELNKEYTGMRGKWDVGEISKEEWTKYYQGFGNKYPQILRGKEFQDLRMKKLEEIEQMPEATKVKPQIYEQMFGIAMGRGEYGKAESYMNKSIEALIKSIKEDHEIKTLGLKASEDTARHTEDILTEIRNGNTLYSNRSSEERGAITRAAQNLTITLKGDDWTQDETMAQVKRALRE